MALDREPAEDGESSPGLDVASVQAALRGLELTALAASVPDPIPDDGTSGFIRLDPTLVVYVVDEVTSARFEIDGAEVCASLRERTGS